MGSERIPNLQVATDRQTDLPHMGHRRKSWLDLPSQAAELSDPTELDQYQYQYQDSCIGESVSSHEPGGVQSGSQHKSGHTLPCYSLSSNLVYGQTTIGKSAGGEEICIPICQNKRPYQIASLFSADRLSTFRIECIGRTLPCIQHCGRSRFPRDWPAADVERTNACIPVTCHCRSRRHQPAEEVNIYSAGHIPMVNLLKHVNDTGDFWQVWFDQTWTQGSFMYRRALSVPRHGIWQVTCELLPVVNISDNMTVSFRADLWAEVWSLLMRPLNQCLALQADCSWMVKWANHRIIADVQVMILRAER